MAKYKKLITTLTKPQFKHYLEEAMRAGERGVIKRPDGTQYTPVHCIDAIVEEVKFVEAE